jgi:hypothetical protein
MADLHGGSQATVMATVRVGGGQARWQMRAMAGRRKGRCGWVRGRAQAGMNAGVGGCEGRGRAQAGMNAGVGGCEGRRGQARGWVRASEGMVW